MLVSTLQASKKEHAEKKALDKEERKRLMSLKKSRKLMRNNKPPNLVSLEWSFQFVLNVISGSVRRQLNFPRGGHLFEVTFKRGGPLFNLFHPS